MLGERHLPTHLCGAVDPSRERPRTFFDLVKDLVYNGDMKWWEAYRIMFDTCREVVMTVRTVNVHEAKTQLSQLLLRISMGEDVVIAKAGKPVARLVPYTAQPVQRVPGSAQGQVWIAPDFNAPLPDEVLAAFEA